MRALFAAFAMCGGSVLAGCGEGAVLEVHLDLPPSGGGRGAAYLQARSGDVSFDLPWSDDGSGDDLELAGAARTSKDVSIVASGDQIDRELRLRLWFCFTPRCSAPADETGASEIRIRVTRAFYEGRYTSIDVAVPEMPPAGTAQSLVFERCDVAGCIPGPSNDHCRMDGTHFCE